MSNNQSPWGGNNNSVVPPDLDEVLKDFKSKFSNFFNNKNNDNKTGRNGKDLFTGKIKYLFILIIIVWGLSGIYIVDPAERGVVMRFGKFTEITAQGPHWHMPYPIETVNIINVSEIRKMEIGFRNVVNNVGRKFTRKITAESLMLTEDENIVDALFEVQYNISSAKDYLFNVLDPEKTLEQVANSAIREVIGKHKMDFIITEGRAIIAQEIQEKSQELLDNYKVGLYISAVNFNSAQAPKQVQEAYSDVTKAKTDKKRYINQAQSYSNDILPKARGASARIIEEANAYKFKVISKSEGEANRFEQILAEYKKAPKVTKERLYRETMENVLASTSKIVVDSKSNSLMYLPIDKLISNASVEKNNKKENSNQQINNNTQNNVRDVFRNRGANQ